MATIEPKTLKSVLFLPCFAPKPPPNVPRFSLFQGDASALNFSPFTPRKSPSLTPGQAEICTKKYGVLAKNTMFCLKISP